MEAELAKLGAALRGGKGVATIGDWIEQAERRKAELHACFEHLDGLSKANKLDTGNVRAELQQCLGEWQARLLAHPVQVRQVLRKVISGHHDTRPRDQEVPFRRCGRAGAPPARRNRSSIC